MTHDVERACAVLGVAPGASAAQLKRQHRKLVKRWHPDRFANDPEAQAAAGQQLARINTAYRLLTDDASAGRPTAPPATAGTPPPPSAFGTGRLRREEIDRLVEAINARPTDGGVLGGVLEQLATSFWERARRLRLRRLLALLLLLAPLVTGAVWFVAWLHGREIGDVLWFSWLAAGAVLMCALGALAVYSTR